MKIQKLISIVSCVLFISACSDEDSKPTIPSTKVEEAAPTKTQTETPSVAPSPQTPTKEIPAVMTPAPIPAFIDFPKNSDPAVIDFNTLSKEERYLLSQLKVQAQECGGDVDHRIVHVFHQPGIFSPLQDTVQIFSHWGTLSLEQLYVLEPAFVIMTEIKSGSVIKAEYQPYWDSDPARSSGWRSLIQYFSIKNPIMRIEDLFSRGRLIGKATYELLLCDQNQNLVGGEYCGGKAIAKKEEGKLTLYFNIYANPFLNNSYAGVCNYLVELVMTKI